MGVPGPNRSGGRREGDGPGPRGTSKSGRASGSGRARAAGGASGKPVRPAARKSSDMNRPNAQDRRDSRPANAHGKFSFVIPSDFTAGRDVQRQIMADVARNGFDDDNTFAIRIALEEALVNAIKHGNRLDPGKKVRVEATVTPDRAEITVEDEGPGFNRADVPDPTCDENICRPSGRGILLIESYMNDVRWDRGGRRIHMVKHNDR